MSNRTIYFPRLKFLWQKSRDLKFNAYLNMFRYVKADIDEVLLSVLAGGEIPLIREGKLILSTINTEKTISYVMGLYYEEYLHEDKRSYKSSVIKNLKMRIAVPILMIDADNGGVREEIPALCCGYDQEADEFIVVDPGTGDLRNADFEEMHLKGGQMKMFMLNVPGMIKMHCIDRAAMINQALAMYITRFSGLGNTYLSEKSGYDAIRWTLENFKEEANGDIKRHINNQINWFQTVHQYDAFLNVKVNKNLADIENYYYSVAMKEGL